MLLDSAFADLQSHGLGLAVSLAIGLLIGLERERSKGDGPNRGAAGVRTFSILGLTGAVAGLIGPAAIYVSGAFVAVAMAMGYARTRGNDPGLTTEMSMLLTFLLGMFALPSPGLAGALGIVAAMLLAGKGALHRISRQWLTAAELRDFLILLASAFVILPLLPDTSIDPWEAINPRRLWLLVVAIMAIATVGYLSLRLLGMRFGLAIAGIAGGFVSSTVTVLAMADRAIAHPAQTASAASAAIMSNIGTLVQFAVVVGAIHPLLLQRIAWPLAMGVCATLAAGVAVSWRSFLRGENGDSIINERPFEPLTVLKTVALLAIIMLALAAARTKLGGASLPWMMVISALADVHAAAAAAAQAAATDQITASRAVLCLTIAMATNGVWKCAVAFFKGKLGYAWRVSTALALINATFIVTVLVQS